MRTESIRRIGDGRNFIPKEDLYSLKSVVAEHEASTLTNRYKFLSTMGIVNVLAKERWFPVSAQEQRVRTISREGFQKHMIRFRRQGDKQLDKVGAVAPEIILVNSHDGFTKYNFMLGLFRLACLNGLIVSEAQFASIKVMHLESVGDAAIEASYEMVKAIPNLIDRVDDYKAIELKPVEREAFAESALVMKYASDDARLIRDGSNAVIGERSFNLPALLKPKREEDQSPTLWNTYNVVQEKMVKGNDFERTTREVNGRYIHKTKVQGIRGIDENLRINRGLWHLMEKMAEIRAN
jgi:hypothetical protein